jgi:hypothetical protein
MPAIILRFYSMQLPNIFNWLRKLPLVETPFIQHWDGEGINPPPPETNIIITELGAQMITELTDSLIITE